jgi:trehalose 6-phosphate synthase/phosphatase
MSQRSAQGNNPDIDRLIVVSNRLPIALTKGSEGEWHVQPGSGGLVTALTSILRDKGGLWIGWPGTLEEVDPDELAAMAGKNTGYALKPVTLTAQEINEYYFGFSNEILWPLFHSLQSRCNFDPAYWATYQAVNRKFAQVIAENARATDYIWVHDYHLILVAKELRAIGIKAKVGFFLHIPFPSCELFTILPWRSQILEALLEYDLVGFQTMRDRNNFIYYVESSNKGLRVDTRKQVCTIATSQRQTRVGAFPISIDFKAFTRQAANKSVLEKTKQLRDAVDDRQVILGVDRLDYSKGIPER